MRRIYRVFHRLKPVRVQKRIDNYFSFSIRSGPYVVFGDQRRRLRTQIRPVETNEFLRQVGGMFDGQVELASLRLRRTLHAVSLDIVKPAVIGTGDPSLFHTAIAKRGTAMRTAIGEKPHSPLL